MDRKKVFAEILTICLLSCILGLAVHPSLLKRFARGEFKESFLPLEKYPGMTFITLTETEDLFSKREALFVDSRSRADYAAGHIPRALNLPLEEINRERTQARLDVPLDQMIIVYCSGGECQESIGLAKILYEKGYKNIKVFSGGWDEWKKAGLPEVSGNGPQ